MKNTNASKRSLSPEQIQRIKEIKAKREEEFLQGLRFLGGEDPEDMEGEYISPDDPGYEEALDQALSQLFGCSVEDLHKDKNASDNKSSDKNIQP